MQGFPCNLISLHTQGDRIVAGDAQESVHYATYRQYDNRIVIFADDIQPRFTTCTTMLDYDTIAGGDKFGSVFILRVPNDISQDVDEDPTGNKSIYDRGYLQGAPHRVRQYC